MKSTWEYIKSDLFRYHGKSSFSAFVKSLVLIEGFRYMVFVRLYSPGNRFTNLIVKLFLRHYSYKYGIQIPLSTAIGKGFYIGHFGTIVINGNAIIGNNVNVSPGVIIGQVSRGKFKGVPTIEDKVWIGANAVIVGKIVVGRESLIAPGTYVNFDVPPKSLVRGNPGVITEGSGVEGYICNEWPV